MRIKVHGDYDIDVGTWDGKYELTNDEIKLIKKDFWVILNKIKENHEQNLQVDIWGNYSRLIAAVFLNPETSDEILKIVYDKKCIFVDQDGNNVTYLALMPIADEIEIDVSGVTNNFDYDVRELKFWKLVENGLMTPFTQWQEGLRKYKNYNNFKNGIINYCMLNYAKSSYNAKDNQIVDELDRYKKLMKAYDEIEKIIYSEPNSIFDEIMCLEDRLIESSSDIYEPVLFIRTKLMGLDTIFDFENLDEYDMEAFEDRWNLKTGFDTAKIKNLEQACKNILDQCNINDIDEILSSNLKNELQALNENCNNFQK